MSPTHRLAAVPKAGLIFAALFIYFAKTEAAQISHLVPRKGGGGGGGDAGDDDDDDDDTSKQCANNVCLICVKTTCVTVTSTPPGPAPTSNLPPTSIHNSVPLTPTPTPTPTPLPTGTPSPSATKSGDLSTNTQLPVTAIQSHSRVSAGSIIGAVIGSLVILGLILMMIHKVLARKRKARKRPSGFVPATYFNVGNGDNNNSRSLPDPEMSQTQSSPLISTAMAAHVASRHSIAPSSAYSSASPIPVTILSSASSGPHRSLSTSLSASTSSHRRASLSETEASSHWPHEPLINPYEMPPPAWSISNQNPTSTATGITTPSPTLSRVSQLPSPAPALMPNVLSSIPLAQPGDTNLLRSMTAHQKALEAEGEKSLVDSSSSANASSSALASETKKDNQYDPPPQYRD